MFRLLIFILLVLLSLASIFKGNAQKIKCKEVQANNLKKGQFWLLCDGAQASSGNSGNGDLLASGAQLQPVYRPKPTPQSFGYWG